MEDVLETIRNTISNLDPKEKEVLLNSVLGYASHYEGGRKYNIRVSSDTDPTEYTTHRLKMLEQKLKTKFGLAI